MTTVPAVPTPPTAVPIVALPTVPPTTIPSTGWNGLYTDAPGTGVLRIGDKGQRVAELQTALGDAGLLDPPYDGDFGRGTEAALLEFQRSQGLVADGLAGSRTLAALGLGVGFESYDDAIAATLRFLNSGDRTGLSQRMIHDLQNFAGLGTSLGAQWAAGGQVSSGSSGTSVFSFSLGGSGGVYEYIEVTVLAAPGHSWNGVVYAQGH